MEEEWMQERGGGVRKKKEVAERRKPGNKAGNVMRPNNRRVWKKNVNGV